MFWQVCNLLAELVPYIAKHIRAEDDSVIELVVQVADFLIEVMQGPCAENQRFLCAGDLLIIVPL